MGRFLVVKLMLISSLVFKAISIFCCSSSMQLNHLRLQGNETDRLALLAIKAQIQHDPNRVTSSWNESLHFCLWQGVNCSRRHDQRVTKLNLGSLELVGSISPHIGNLSFLRVLIFENNSFTGLIPPQIGNLHRLHVFSVARNNMEGSIPSSLCRLRKLTFFGTDQNRLSGIIPSCIYNLSAIVTFYISENQIQGSLPANLSNAFPKLQLFSIFDNQFSGPIPLSLSKAENLVRFQCSSNKLTGQVPNLQNLHNLELFSVGGNNLGSGKQGDLAFVSDLVNATRLIGLELSLNNFGGTLPTSISNLSTNLKWLGIQDNSVHGSIPAGLRNLVNLQILGMGGNSFTGSIPTDIGMVSGLGQLYLNNNQFSGSIPSSLGNLTSLTVLHLQGNNLEGRIPSSLGKCHSLEELALYANNLNGTIPLEIFGLPSLSINLALGRNQMTGSLPMEIGQLKNLGWLLLNDNLLSGELPSSLGSCQSLQLLYLEGNSFLGPIPSSVKELRGIQDLDLSRNNFSGGIPQFFEGLGNLVYLNLSFNQFSGAVPTGGIFKNASATSVTGNTELCGGIANFHLEVCKSKAGGGGLSGRMKLMASLVSGFTLLGVVVVLSFFLVRKRKDIELSILGTTSVQFSYAAILKATDGFSSANLIGVGAFGSVYKGSFSENGVIVAVKVFNMIHRGASKSFISECEALRNIRHRNLVKILTTCSSIDFRGNDFRALVYEYMEKGSLEEWLHPFTRTEEVTEVPKSLSLIQRLDIAIDVASALDYLHNHCATQIVHCDLKPSNVLLDTDLTGHVSDFGISKFLSDSTTVAENQSSSIGIRGSVGYAAPEYGMGSEVSTYGDVYSFGILLLEMFTGKRPTDQIFSDGLNLHNYVKTALPERVSVISGSLILQEDTTNVAEARLSIIAHKIECLTLIFGIGIACSVESPTNRKNISDAVSELQTIRRKIPS